MNSPEAVEAAVAAGADALGFVFAESPRQVTPEQAKALCAGVPAHVPARRRHAPPAQGALGARHRGLRAELAANRCRGLPLDQAAGELHGAARLSRQQRARRLDLPDRLLFEGTHSGSGRVADWDEASGLARVAEVILAGGLDRRQCRGRRALRAPVGRRRVERRRARARREGSGQDHESSSPACERSRCESMETKEREALLAGAARRAAARQERPLRPVRRPLRARDPDAGDRAAHARRRAHPAVGGVPGRARARAEELDRPADGADAGADA